MRKLFTFVTLLIVCHSAKAQLVIYSENFDEESGYAISGWPYEYSGSVPWQAGLPAQVGGCMLPAGGPMSYELGTNKVACIADCGPMFNPNDSNVFSYTPPVSLSSITGAWLKYDSYFNQYSSAGDTEKATVEISTDDGATWTVIQQVQQSIPYGTFATQYIDLSAYDHAPDIRIGFRYADGGGWLQGWAIDNVEVFKPAHKDLALLSLTPAEPLMSYVTIGNGITHHTLVYNAGLDTIHSFTLNYQLGTGPVKQDMITGENLLPFSTTDFTHNIPDTLLSLGNFPVTMWVTLDSDEYLYNDTARTTLRGADFIPSKRLTLECGEGTWHGRSPNCMVDMAVVPTLDIGASIVEVHSGDPMRDTAYSNFLYNIGYNFVPYILFDRRKSVPLDSFFNYLNVQTLYFGYANLDLSATFDGTSLSADVTIKPAIDLSGDYRVALVITEDKINSNAYGYDQQNNYAGGALGPMGGYESLPNPVPGAQMTYNNLGRLIYPNPEGQASCLPATLSAGEIYDCALSTTIDPAWNTANLHVIALLINHGDSAILNSVELPVTLKTPTLAATLFSAGIYPNPADAATRVFFDLINSCTAHIAINDLTGRMLYECPQTIFATGRNIVNIPVQQLANGMYLVNITTPEGQRTLKLEVMH